MGCKGKDNVAGLIVVLLLPMVLADPVPPQNASKENPFYMESFDVPTEQKTDGSPKTILTLLWIPRKDLGCQINHNEDIKRALPMWDYERKSLCEHFCLSRFYRIKRVVQHNIVVLLKVKAIKLFNDHWKFKKVVFPAKRNVSHDTTTITDLTADEFLGALNTTMDNLENGMTFPYSIAPYKVPYESFTEEFGEGLRVYNDLNKIPEYGTPYKGPVEEMRRFVMGEEYTPLSKIDFSYYRYNDRLEEGIRMVIKYFTGENNIKKLLFPMVPPCFE